MANRNWLSNKMYQMEAYPVLVSCTFTVDNTSGTGISGLAGGTVQSVYMNSVAPSSGHPNPAASCIQIQLQDNYNKLLGLCVSLQEPTSGVPLAAVVSGTPYVITLLGTTSLAQWQAVGLPQGVTPAVGVAFVATATQAIGGTGAVQTCNGCDVDSVELLGDPNQTLALSNSAVNGGAILQLICRKAGAPQALPNGSVVRVNMYLSNSSVTVNGQ